MSVCQNRCDVIQQVFSQVIILSGRLSMDLLTVSCYHSPIYTKYNYMFLLNISQLATQHKVFWGRNSNYN